MSLNLEQGLAETPGGSAAVTGSGTDRLPPFFIQSEWFLFHLSPYLYFHTLSRGRGTVIPRPPALFIFCSFPSASYMKSIFSLF